ncbi:MAG TPA: hypothetical protein VLQ92_00315, partial [Candidatus Limnocylindrales bacterium]|nr:hypothetical protein [Candidatus Limnocylindrales bacterium]
MRRSIGRLASSKRVRRLLGDATDALGVALEAFGRDVGMGRDPSGRCTRFLAMSLILADPLPQVQVGLDARRPVHPLSGERRHGH